MSQKFDDKLERVEESAAPKVNDAEFEFYDKIYHPQTGGWIQGQLFRQAFADYLTGKFDPQHYMRLLKDVAND